MSFRSFTFSTGVSSDKDRARSILNKLYPGIREVKTPLGTETLTIATQNEIMSVYGSPRYYATISVLEDVDSMKLDRIPFPSIHQIASLCFNRVYALIVGFTQQESLELAKYIVLLGGKFTPHFNSDITVAISPTFLSSRINQVTEINIPVVTSQWVKKSFESLTCFEPNSCLLPPFSGLQFTSTDLTPSEHKRIRNLVEQNGGFWSDLYNEKTSIVISHSLCTSRKTELALKENVPIIKPSWIYDCSSKFVPHQKYLINWWCESTNKSDLFAGMSFSIHCDVNNLDVLTEIIKMNGGEMKEDASHYIVPYDFKGTGNFVTPRYIYDCVTEKELLDTKSNVLYTPLGYNLPLDDCKNKIFSLLDLPETTRQFVAEGVRIIGGKVIYKESRNSDFFVTTKSFNDKCVSSYFVIDILEKGKIPNMKCFPALPQTPLLKKICMDIIRQPKQNMQSPATAVPIESVDDFTQKVSATYSQDIIEYDLVISQSQFVSNSKGQNDPLMLMLNDER